MNWEQNCDAFRALVALEDSPFGYCEPPMDEPAPNLNYRQEVARVRVIGLPYENKEGIEIQVGFRPDEVELPIGMRQREWVVGAENALAASGYEGVNLPVMGVDQARERIQIEYPDNHGLIEPFEMSSRPTGVLSRPGLDQVALKKIQSTKIANIKNLEVRKAALKQLESIHQEQVEMSSRPKFDPNAYPSWNDPNEIG